MFAVQLLRHFLNSQWLQRNERRIMALLTIVAALVVARNILAHLRQDAFSREDGSWAIATNLVQGKGYTVCESNYFPFCGQASQQTAMRPPVPVLLMAFAMLFSSSHIAGVAVQGLLYAATARLIFAFLRPWDRRVALFAACLWVLSIAVIHEIDTDGGDMAAAFFFCAGLLFFQRGRQKGGLGNWLLAGLMLGLASLCRSVMLGLAAALLAGLLWERRATVRETLLKSLAPALLGALAFSAVLAPWAIRNQVVFGNSVVSGTLVGYNIYRMNYFLQDDHWTSHYVGPDEALRAIHSLIQDSSLRGNENEVQMQAFYSASGMQIIRSHPAGYVVLSLYRFLPLWFDVSVHEAYGQKFGFLEGLEMLQQAFFLMAALAGAFLYRKQFWPLILCIVLASAAYMAVDAQLRYLTDVMPAVVMLAAAAIKLVDSPVPAQSFRQAELAGN